MTEQNEVKQEAVVPEPFPLLEGLGESGGQAFTQVRKIDTKEDGTTEIIEVNLTARGRNATEAMHNLGDALRYANTIGFRAYRTYDAPKALPATAPAGMAVPATLPLPGAVTMPPVNASGSGVGVPPPSGGIIHANKMTTKPRPDGKVDISFFEGSHQFADITKTCTVEAAILFLAPLGTFTPAHLSVAAEYKPVFIDVRYVLSEKMNSKGNPYKNIVDITKTA